MRFRLLALVAGMFIASPALAATWNVYMPPAHAGSQPPPFSASTWALVSSYTDDQTDDCAGASLALQKQYWDQGDMAKSKRALEVVCVNQETNETAQP